MSNIRRLQERSTAPTSSSSTSASALGSSLQTVGRVGSSSQNNTINLYSTPNDHLVALVAAGEKAASRDQRMAELFTRGKVNKEQGLMALQRKQWASESLKLHQARLSAEAEVEEAMRKAVDALMMSSTTKGGAGGKGDGQQEGEAPFLASDVGSLTAIIAMKALQEEFTDDARVTNEIANRLLSEVFNVRAAVVGARSKSASIRAANDLLEQGLPSSASGGRRQGAGAAGVRNGGQGRAQRGAAFTTTSTRRTAPSSFTSSAAAAGAVRGRGGAATTSTSARSASSSSSGLRGAARGGGGGGFPSSARLPASAGSGGGGVGGIGIVGVSSAGNFAFLSPNVQHQTNTTVGIAAPSSAPSGEFGRNAAAASGNRGHRSATMSSPEEEAGRARLKEEEENPLLTHPSYIAPHELATLEKDLTSDLSKIQQILLRIKDTLRGEMEEWNGSDATALASAGEARPPSASLLSRTASSSSSARGRVGPANTAASAAEVTSHPSFSSSPAAATAAPFEAKLAAAEHDQIGKLLKSLLEEAFAAKKDRKISGKKAKSRDDRREDEKGGSDENSECDGSHSLAENEPEEEEEQRLIFSEARLALQRLITATGAASTLVGEMFPSSRQLNPLAAGGSSSTTATAAAGGGHANYLKSFITSSPPGRFSTSASSVLGGDFTAREGGNAAATSVSAGVLTSASSRRLASSHVSAVMSLENLEKDVDTEFSLMMRRFVTAALAPIGDEEDAKEEEGEEKTKIKSGHEAEDAGSHKEEEDAKQTIGHAADDQPFIAAISVGDIVNNNTNTDKTAHLPLLERAPEDTSCSSGVSKETNADKDLNGRVNEEGKGTSSIGLASNDNEEKEKEDDSEGDDDDDGDSYGEESWDEYDAAADEEARKRLEELQSQATAAAAEGGADPNNNKKRSITKARRRMRKMLAQQKREKEAEADRKRQAAAAAMHVAEHNKRAIETAEEAERAYCTSMRHLNNEAKQRITSLIGLFRGAVTEKMLIARGDIVGDVGDEADAAGDIGIGIGIGIGSSCSVVEAVGSSTFTQYDDDGAPLMSTATRGGKKPTDVKEQHRSNNMVARRKEIGNTSHRLGGGGSGDSDAPPSHPLQKVTAEALQELQQQQDEREGGTIADEYVVESIATLQKSTKAKNKENQKIPTISSSSSSSSASASTSSSAVTASSNSKDKQSDRHEGKASETTPEIVSVEVNNVRFGGDSYTEEVNNSSYDAQSTTLHAKTKFSTTRVGGSGVREARGIGESNKNKSAATVSLVSTLSSNRLGNVDAAVVERIRDLITQYRPSARGAPSSTKGIKKGGASAATTTTTLRGTVLAKASSAVAIIDPASNKARELLHHRIRLEFPNLTTNQIVSICRGIAEEEQTAKRLGHTYKKVAAEVRHLMDSLSDALRAEEAALVVERERIEWQRAEDLMRAETMKKIKDLREQKQERDAEALETLNALEEQKKAEEAKKAALRQQELDERLRKLALYQQDKAEMAEREAALKLEEQKILDEEKRQQSLHNTQRVAARKKVTQEALDRIRLERLELEQEAAEKEVRFQRFYEAIQQKLGVERSAERAMQLTEAKKNVTGTELLVNQTAAQYGGRGDVGGAVLRSGYTDESIMSDPRFRIHQALISAGLQNTSYARELVSGGCGYKMSRHNALSEGHGAFW